MPPRSLPTTRVPMHRMVHIHRRIQEGRRVNCTALASELEVDRKTILRDIRCMRDDLDLPIVYDEHQHTYYYEHDVGELPVFDLSEGELLALFVAEKALAPLEGTPFARKVGSGLQKLSAALGDAVSLTWSELDEGMTFRQTAVAHADAEVFERLTRAVRREKEVRFEYRKLGATHYSRRTVHPYHVANVDGQWYLFAHDVDRDALRKFVLTRMRKVEVLRSGFRKPADFSVIDQLKDSFGIFSSSGKRLKVRIRFDVFAAQLIRERSWHESQRIKELDDGEIEMSMTLGSLEEVERWVLSWGRHAEVQGPRKLRERVRKAAAAILENHGPG